MDIYIIEGSIWKNNIIVLFFYNMNKIYINKKERNNVYEECKNC